MFKIIPYDRKYRDDMLLCYLLAKDAISNNIRLSEDLLDIQGRYFDKGDMFWLALGEDNRVVGMIGTNTISPADMWLKRLFIKPNHKRKGIATALLATAEEWAKTRKIETINTRFASHYAAAPTFYSSKGYIEIGVSNGNRHFAKNIKPI